MGAVAVMPAQRPLALVSGASSGIGLALARLLARDGIDLVLVARRGALLEQIAGELRAAGAADIQVIVADLTADGAVDAVMAAVAATGRTIDILINNAGTGWVGDFADVPAADIARMGALNMTAPTLLARAVLPAMIKAGRGHILNVASTAGFQPGPGMAVYFATKAYVLSLSQALWMELRRTGVTVTALCPGPTASEFGDRSGISATPTFGGILPVASAEDVAAYGYAAMKRGRRLAVHGTINRLGTLAATFAPLRLTLAFMRYLLSR
jgi:short-subunit dehydrogenase